MQERIILTALASMCLRTLQRVLQDAGFLIYEHLNETEMTEQFFAAYNSGSPAHTMTAPKGVGYITAVNKENKYLERGKSS